ncbi:hypothetical protein HG536_0A06940 [Torulaspora globosa]|uniref:Ureidoglycolate lyase n=1 Tax=Torulaspora globosa TaxID=48254 RepID=A0A7G3ZBJ3_9SACH|nr:uncharacterized protein HG536_0A06940 [Torulaspora globosa]QLL30879.1 hypothetical protein HG536_0A06940 [Torulaspora globosa]
MKLNDLTLHCQQKIAIGGQSTTMAVLIKATPLTIDAFAPYGSIISPDEQVSNADDSSRTANQGTAIKLLGVSQIEKKYPFEGTPNWNLFRCFSQPHLRGPVSISEGRAIEHSIRVLEKHPSSSQTFIPMGCPEHQPRYLVVVALEDCETGRPDLSTLKAFLCRGNQAVTYGAGIWHAPMIALGNQEYIDFGVVIYEFHDPKAPEKDCQEHHYGDGSIKVQLFQS